MIANTQSDRAKIQRRISEIGESLARPAEEGAQWDKRRDQLQRELDRLKSIRAGRKN